MIAFCSLDRRATSINNSSVHETTNRGAYDTRIRSLQAPFHLSKSASASFNASLVVSFKFVGQVRASMWREFAKRRPFWHSTLPSANTARKLGTRGIASTSAKKNSRRKVKRESGLGSDLAGTSALVVFDFRLDFDIGCHTSTSCPQLGGESIS